MKSGGLLNDGILISIVSTYIIHIYIYIYITWVVNHFEFKKKNHTPLKTNMTLENRPFEDVFPIENGDFPMSC